MRDVYQYYVEGEDEKRFLEVLKTDMRLIVPGKIQVVNVVEESLSDLRLRILTKGTILVFVFDTDTRNFSILNSNIIKAKNSSNIKDVYCVTQVKNFEDELVRSTNLTKIEDFTRSQSKKNFKRDFIRDKNIKQKLYNYEFDFEKLWIKTPPKPFDTIVNCSSKIKKC